MTPTISNASDWAAVLRGERDVQVVVCELCGGKRMALGGPHAPRWREERLVDCSGNEVRGSAERSTT